MFRHLTVLLLIATAWPLRVFAADPLSLADAVRIAAEQAPRLDASAAAIAAAEADASRAGALPDPMLMVGIENLPVTGDDAFDATVEDMTMRVVGVRQDFPAAAKRDAQRLLARRQVDEARAEGVVQRLAVQRAAADAWIDAWAADLDVQTLEALRVQAQLASTLARARARGGTGSLADALAAEAAEVDIAVRIEVAQGGREAALAELRRWVPGTAGPSHAETPDFGSLPVSPAELHARLDQAAFLLGSTARMETAAVAVEASRAERRPDWSLTASYGQRGLERSDMVSVEVAIGLPWFQRHRRDRDVLAREAEYQGALALRDDDRRAFATAVDAAFARWESLKRQAALHEQRLLPLAADRSAAALAAYRGGGELQPWLDARAAELDVHRAHVEHLGAMGRAWAALAFLLPENTP